MHRFATMAVLVAFGCSEREFTVSNVPEDITGIGWVSGRVCNEATQTWLEGALIYAHMFDEQGVVFDTVITHSDDKGKWELELASERSYDIYVQVGNAVLQQLPVDIIDDETVVIPDPPCLGPVDAAVAVVSGDYDNLEDLFPSLGVTTWTHVNGQTGNEIVQFLTDEEALAEFDIVFFDGGHLEDGIFYGDSPDVRVVNNAIQNYVENGGTLFASDWSYDVIEINWPDKIEFMGDDAVPDAAQVGETGIVSASVLDSGMETAVGAASVDVTYDFAVWPVVESVGDGVTVYLQGDAPWRDGFDTRSMSDSPLLVGFSAGSGNVYLSTYRQGANSDGPLLDGLRFLMQ
jgi:hypothetical protein